MSYELTVAQLAWLAGILDGEGCLTAGAYRVKGDRRDGSTRYRLSVFVSVTNTNEDIILTANELFASLTGVKPTLHVHDSTSRSRNHLTQKTCYRVHVSGGPSVSAVLTAVLPYLVGKRRQAELLLAIIAHRQQVCRTTGRKDKACRIEADTWLREQLASIRIANWRGPNRELRSLT